MHGDEDRVTPPTDHHGLHRLLTRREEGDRAVETHMKIGPQGADHPLPLYPMTKKEGSDCNLVMGTAAREELVTLISDRPQSLGTKMEIRYTGPAYRAQDPLPQPRIIGEGLSVSTDLHLRPTTMMVIGDRAVADPLGRSDTHRHQATGAGLEHTTYAVPHIFLISRAHVGFSHKMDSTDQVTVGLGEGR